jgi:Spy/CpxP family protein refolding chaperone
MNKPITRAAVGALVATGLMFAQAPPPAPAARTRAAVRPRATGQVARLARYLELTENQRAQVRSIFQAAQADAKPLADQAKQARQALASAIASNAPDAQLDQLAAPLGPIAAQRAAIRAKTLAKVYALLTPDQKTKFDALKDRILNGQGPGTPAANGRRRAAARTRQR